MAKAPMDPKRRLFWLITLGVSAMVAVWALGGEETTGSKSATKRPPVTAKTKQDAFRPEDYTAQFPAVNNAARNSFRPLIVRKDPSLSSIPTISNEIPSAFTGGEAGWMLTGISEVNGAKSALVENKSTGEGVFLAAGETFRVARVLTITEDSMVLQGPEGITRTIRMPVDLDMPEGDVSVTPLPLPGLPRTQTAPPGNRPNAGANRQGSNRQGTALAEGVAPAAVTLSGSGPMSGVAGNGTVQSGPIEVVGGGGE